MGEQFEITKIVKLEVPKAEYVEGISHYRVFFKYNGRSAYMTIFITDELEAEKELMGECLKANCLALAREHFDNYLPQKGE